MNTTSGQLVIRLESRVVQQVDLHPGALILGRLPGVDVVLGHPLISREHAELRREGPDLVLTDLGSANGTFVGETRLLPDQPHLLAPGAVFRIGPFLISYEAEVHGSGVAGEREPVEIPEDEPAAVQPFSAPPTHPAAAEAPLPIIPPRATYPPAAASRAVSQYLDHLPAPYQEGDFLGRFLLIFESLWEPLEQRQDAISMYFDPATCPSSFIPWLESWLDIGINQNWSEARRRRLLTEATELYRWRGTRYGMTRMLEVCTDLTPVILDVEENPYVFEVRIKVPTGRDVDRAFFDKLILAHKPAHAGYVLEVTR